MSAPVHLDEARCGGCPPEAEVVQWVWKTPAMERLAVEVCRLAVSREEFSALDLSVHGEAEHGGSGVAGAVFGRLAKGGIIEAARFVAGGKAYPKTVANACGNPIKLWRPASRALARAFLAAHGEVVPVQAAAVQGEFEPLIFTNLN